MRAYRFVALAAVTALAIVSEAMGACLARRQSLVTPPSQDPFYQPPAGFERTPPGTVLKSRMVQAALYGAFPLPYQTYQLLYRTSSINGSAIATVTTVFVPTGAKPDRFITYQTAEDSSASQCAPSYNFQLGANNSDTIITTQFLEIQLYIGQGYIVASPDYEGPDSAFAMGHLAGQTILDNIRAVRNFGPRLGLYAPNPAVVGYGYSGGALATGWAAALQNVYAKELNTSVKGWAFGGTPANLTGTALTIDGTLFAGFLPAAIAGYLQPSTYKAGLQPLVDRIITQEGRDAIAYAESHCSGDNMNKFAGERIQSTKYQTEGDRLFYDPTLQQYSQYNIMATNKSETPVVPVYMAHSVTDEVIPYQNASTAAQRWCDYGASVRFSTVDHGGHIVTEITIAPYVNQFIQQAFAGNVSKGCSRDTIPGGVLNTALLPLDAEPIAVALANKLLALGQNDDAIQNNITNFQNSYINSTSSN